MTRLSDTCDPDHLDLATYQWDSVHKGSVKLFKGVMSNMGTKLTNVFGSFV